MYCSLTHSRPHAHAGGRSWSKSQLLHLLTDWYARLLGVERPRPEQCSVEQFIRTGGHCWRSGTHMQRIIERVGFMLGQ